MIVTVGKRETFRAIFIPKSRAGSPCAGSSQVGRGVDERAPSHRLNSGAA